MSDVPQNDKSLPEQLAELIIDHILEHNLKQGDRLPKETELAELLGAGRSSVREAIKLLASRNIVTVKQGSGTYVSSAPGMVEDPLGLLFVQDKAALARDLLQLRFMIEPQVASMAAIHASNEDVERISLWCGRVEKALRAGADHTQSDMEFHRAIALSSGNTVVPRIIPIINASVPLFIDVTGNALHDETIATHRALCNAIAAHDPIAAHDASYLHLVYNRARMEKYPDGPDC